LPLPPCCHLVDIVTARDVDGESRRAVALEAAKVVDALLLAVRDAQRALVNVVAHCTSLAGIKSCQTRADKGADGVAACLRARVNLRQALVHVRALCPIPGEARQAADENSGH
jgi:hypothetical protein